MKPLAMEQYRLDSSPRFSLATGSAELWLCRIPSGLDEQHFTPYQHDLSASELLRCAKYRYESGKVQCLITRVMLRRLLSWYGEHPPGEWAFKVGPFGKPFLAQRHRETGLKFNLSHTDGMVACVIGRQCEVGVDVEGVDRSLDYRSIAEHSFSREEVRRLAQLGEEAAKERFFSLWTLKESYIKALGQGLSYGLDKAIFDFDNDGGARLAGAESKSSWQFVQLRPTSTHAVAVCLESTQGATGGTLRVRELLFE